MILTETQFKELIHGAYSFKKTENEYIYFTHYTDTQIEYLKFHKPFYDRARFSSSITVEFITEAENIEFSYKILEIGSRDSVDVYVNGVAVYIHSLRNALEEDKITFKLNKGKKQVVIYLPIDMIFAIKDFCLDGHYQPVSKRETKVLWIGDSITQGYGSAYTSHSYVNVANRRLGYELLNQGIGGYYYDCNIIQPLPDFSPDKIIVSLGINGHINPEKEKMINDYYKALVHLYPNIPILSITPLWAKADWIDMQGVLDTAKFIRNNAKMYPQISVLDGFELVPHLSEYFIDGVHPNTLGMTLYAYNLVKEIESIGF